MTKLLRIKMAKINYIVTVAQMQYKINKYEATEKLNATKPVKINSYK